MEKHYRKKWLNCHLRNQTRRKRICTDINRLVSIFENEIMLKGSFIYDAHCPFLEYFCFPEYSFLAIPPIPIFHKKDEGELGRSRDSLV